MLLQKTTLGTTLIAEKGKNPCDFSIRGLLFAVEQIPKKRATRRDTTAAARGAVASAGILPGLFACPIFFIKRYLQHKSSSGLGLWA